MHLSWATSSPNKLPSTCKYSRVFNPSVYTTKQKLHITHQMNSPFRFNTFSDSRARETISSFKPLSLLYLCHSKQMLYFWCKKRGHSPCKDLTIGTVVHIVLLFRCLQTSNKQLLPISLAGWFLSIKNKFVNVHCIAE